jgi:hypothetical protein
LKCNEGKTCKYGKNKHHIRNIFAILYFCFEINNLQKYSKINVLPPPPVSPFSRQNDIIFAKLLANRQRLKIQKDDELAGWVTPDGF